MLQQICDDKMIKIVHEQHLQKDRIYSLRFSFILTHLKIENKQSIPSNTNIVNTYHIFNLLFTTTKKTQVDQTQKSTRAYYGEMSLHLKSNGQFAHH